MLHNCDSRKINMKAFSQKEMIKKMLIFFI